MVAVSTAAAPQVGSLMACAAPGTAGRERLKRGLPCSKQRCPPCSTDYRLKGDIVEHVVIGMDPHKRSVTIEVITGAEKILAKRRFATTAVGFKVLLRFARQWPDRLWAVEGCNGIGRHVASRLLTAGETVVDVPPKLSAKLRMSDTRQGPQDRPRRCPRDRAGRRPDERAPAGGQRRSAHHVADPGRPAPRPGRGPHPHGLSAPGQ